MSAWRVVIADGEVCYQVWTRLDESAGGRNNYIIADGIQSEAEAKILAAAPELLEALKSLTKATHATAFALTPDQISEAASSLAFASFEAQKIIAKAEGSDSGL